MSPNKDAVDATIMALNAALEQADKITETSTTDEILNVEEAIVFLLKSYNERVRLCDLRVDFNEEERQLLYQTTIKVVYHLNRFDALLQRTRKTLH
jgi:hypothetical protein